MLAKFHASIKARPWSGPVLVDRITLPIIKQTLEVRGAALSGGADRRPVLERRPVSRSIPLLGIRESGGAQAHPSYYWRDLAGVAVNRSVANDGSPARAHY